MRIRIKPDHTIAGPGVVAHPDGTAEAPELLALAMIGASVAEALGSAPGGETAEAPKGGETAEAPKAGPRPAKAK